MRKAEPGRGMKPGEVWMFPIEQLLNNCCLTLVSANQRDSPDLSNHGTRSRVERLLPCQAKATRLNLLTRRSSSSGTAAGAHPGDLHAAGVKTPQFFRKSYPVAHSTCESSDLTEQNCPDISAHLKNIKRTKLWIASK